MFDASDKEYLQQMESRIMQAMTEQRQDIMQSVNVLFETKVQKQFDLLAEGQQMIMETLAPKNRVEALEDEVAFLKSVIRQISDDVQQLKKAQ